VSSKSNGTTSNEIRKRAKNDISPFSSRFSTLRVKKIKRAGDFVGFYNNPALSTGGCLSKNDSAVKKIIMLTDSRAISVSP
jgi:hypothetical protein